MSEIVYYIIFIPLVSLIYYAVINFIFWNTVKKICFLWFSFEKELEHSEEIKENKKCTKRKK